MPLGFGDGFALAMFERKDQLRFCFVEVADGAKVGNSAREKYFREQEKYLKERVPRQKSEKVVL